MERALLQRLIFLLAQLFNKITNFHECQSFITIFTGNCRELDECSNRISLKSILIQACLSNLRPGSLADLLPSGFLTKMLYIFSLSFYSCCICLCYNLLGLIILIQSNEVNKPEVSQYNSQESIILTLKSLSQLSYEQDLHFRIVAKLSV